MGELAPPKAVTEREKTNDTLSVPANRRATSPKGGGKAAFAAQN